MRSDHLSKHVKTHSNAKAKATAAPIQDPVPIQPQPETPEIEPPCIQNDGTAVVEINIPQVSVTQENCVPQPRFREQTIEEEFNNTSAEDFITATDFSSVAMQ